MFWRKKPKPAPARASEPAPELAPQAELMVELAKAFIELVADVAPAWRVAYYRFRWLPSQFGGNASYVEGDDVQLFNALQHSARLRSLMSVANALATSLGEARGVLLLTVRSDFSYGFQFDYDDVERWRIDKLDGGTGIPAGEPAP